MKKLIKIISLLLCLSILFSSCTKKEKPEETTVNSEEVSDGENTTEKSNKIGDGRVVLS